MAILAILGNVLLIISLCILLTVFGVIGFFILLVIKGKSRKSIFYDEMDSETRKRYKITDKNIIKQFESCDWKEYENKFGSAPPKELVSFYSNQALVLLANFMIKLKGEAQNFQDWELGQYLPLKKGLNCPEFALVEGEKADFPKMAFCFAEDLSGNVYYIIPSENKEEYKVYLYDKSANESVDVSLMNDFLDSSHFYFQPRRVKKLIR